MSDTIRLVPASNMERGGSAVVSAVEAWERYAERAKPRRETNAVGARTWINWTQYPDHGPDESILGDLAGRAVLELGSGTGANLAHLATLGARCVGVDLAPSRAIVAREMWGSGRDLEFVTADAVDYLRASSVEFDVVYSIFGAVWFADPAVLLPLVRASLAIGGRFVFAQLPGQLDGMSDRVVRKWNYSVEHWVRVLAEHGFDAIAEVIAPPVAGQLGTLLVRATAGKPV